MNITDPDTRPIPIGFGFVQGYNAQTAVNEDQIVLAAEITNLSTDFSQLSPMVNATLEELKRADITEVRRLLQAIAADAGYWNEQHMDHVVGEHGIQVLIPPDSGKRQGERPGWTGGRYSFMRRALASELGKELYRKRQQSIEPVYGHTKHNRKIYRFNYRGRQAVRTEWRLITMTHNLTKLHRDQLATVRA